MLLTAATEAVTEVATEAAHVAECTCRYCRQPLTRGDQIMIGLACIFLLVGSCEIVLRH